MELFDKKNETYEFDGYTLFSKGSCANIYKKDDTILKIYNLSCKYKFYLSRKMFELLKKNNIPNLVKLLDYYRLYKSRVLPMDAYTMEYVSGDDVELITASRDYLLRVAKQLEETISMLTNKKIMIFDAQSYNVLFKENGITILDPDQFTEHRLLSRKTLYGYNKMQALNYVTDTIDKEMNSKGYKFDSLDLSISSEDKRSVKEIILSLSKAGNIKDTLIEKENMNGR